MAMVAHAIREMHKAMWDQKTAEAQTDEPTPEDRELSNTPTTPDEWKQAFHTQPKPVVRALPGESVQSFILVAAPANESFPAAVITNRSPFTARQVRNGFKALIRRGLMERDKLDRSNIGKHGIGTARWLYRRRTTA